MKTNSRMMVFVMTMVIGNFAFAQTNLLPNGDFDDSKGIAGWTTAPYDVSFASSVDADKSVGSGSLALGEFGDRSNSTCFSVVPRVAYSFGGKLTLSPSIFGSDGQSKLVCNAYSDGSCMSLTTDLGVLIAGAGDLANGFYTEGPIVGTLGPNDRFVQCTVSNIGFLSTIDTGVPSFVDDLFFNSEAPILPLLGGYLSGSWYDPTQSGQGFQLEFTGQGNTLLATWYTYSPNGSGTTQWVYGQGTYNPTQSSVTIPAVLTSGATFPPNFVASNVKKTPWGNLTFTFTDCDHATMSWSSTVSGYGSGTQQLQRLTSIAGLSCPQ